MLKIIKDNKIYLLVVLLIWLIAIPIVYWQRFAIYSWFSLLVTTPKYSLSTMENFLEKGDDALEDAVSLEAIEEICEEKEKNKKGSAQAIFSCKSRLHLNYMRQACDRSYSLNRSRPPFDAPNWLEKQEYWSHNQELTQGGLGKSRMILPATINPKEYWKNHIAPTLRALDYYKRALNYSGPNFLAVKKIVEVAEATCRREEAILAYSSHIYKTEDYVLEKLQEEEKLPSDLSILQQKKLIWTEIKGNKLIAKDLSANNYAMSLEKLLFDTNFRRSSPEEANKFFLRLIVFSQSDEGKETKNRFKWGMHLFRIGKYEKAVQQFYASTIFTDDYILQSSERSIKSQKFTAYLMIGESYLELQENKKALAAYYEARRLLWNVDGRTTPLVQESEPQRLEALRKKLSIRLQNPILAEKIANE
ncbi:MAG: hypothetical protein AAF518_08190 [Spirochaetota bacterium]